MAEKNLTKQHLIGTVPIAELASEKSISGKRGRPRSSVLRNMHLVIVILEAHRAAQRTRGGEISIRSACELAVGRARQLSLIPQDTVSTCPDDLLRTVWKRDQLSMKSLLNFIESEYRQSNVPRPLRSAERLTEAQLAVNQRAILRWATAEKVPLRS